MLAYGVKWGLLVRKVCDAVDPPRARYKEMTALDAANALELLESTTQSPYGPVIFLTLYTALQRGEVLGLRWCDVDLGSRTLTVNQTIHRISGKGLVIGPPKTHRSRRSAAVQTLLDKQEVYELLMRYCRAIDRCDEPLLRSVYHPDVVSAQHRLIAMLRLHKIAVPFSGDSV